MISHDLWNSSRRLLSCPPHPLFSIVEGFIVGATLVKYCSRCSGAPHPAVVHICIISAPSASFHLFILSALLPPLYWYRATWGDANHNIRNPITHATINELYVEISSFSEKNFNDSATFHGTHEHFRSTSYHYILC